MSQQIEYIPLEKLKPFPGNPKDLMPDEWSKLKADLVKRGLIKSLSVWKKGKTVYVLDGNQRLEVLNELSREGALKSGEIACEPVECADMAQAAEVCLALIGQYGRINLGKLKKFVKKAGFKDMDDAQTAMSFPELDAGWMNTAAASNGEDESAGVNTEEWAKAKVFQCPSCQTYAYVKKHKTKGIDKNDIWDEQQA